MNFIPDTPELLFSEIQKRGHRLAAERHWRKPFVLDQANEAIYKVLAMYFTGDERFETEGPSRLGYEEGTFSLHKGLILAGPKGVGKSDMMDLFARNPRAPYAVVSCLDIETEYDKDGASILDQYASTLPNTYTGHYYGHDKLGICFDDFGAEQDGKHYGKAVNIMDKLLQTRYRLCRGPYTHLTTNASEEQIQTAYDGRVWDRMVQMFNFIEFSQDTPSRRI